MSEGEAKKMIKDYGESRWTHKSLKKNQYLVMEKDITGFDTGFLGYECLGYTNGKRDKSLDGEYLWQNLKPYYPIICADCIWTMKKINTTKELKGEWKNE